MQASSQRFDIIFGPDTLAWFPFQVYVVKRGVEHESRTSALLKFLRDEFELEVDPLDMYSTPLEHTLKCGCEMYATFSTVKVGRLKALRTGERVVPIAEVTRTYCEQHVLQKEPFDGDEWAGTFAAWTHDPKRPAKSEHTGVYG